MIHQTWRTGWFDRMSDDRRVLTNSPEHAEPQLQLRHGRWRYLNNDARAIVATQVANHDTILIW